jgi:hypothetical protein
MFFNKISLESIKQNFSAKVQNIGSFCGRRVEVLKSSASPFVAKIQSASNAAISNLSRAAHKTNKAFSAIKDFISTSISNFVAKIFKKKQAEHAQAADERLVIVPYVGPAPRKEAPAPILAIEWPSTPAEEAPAAHSPTVVASVVTTRSGRAIKSPVRFQP